MSRNASGTYSLPAGNPVVSGTTISSTTHNNTLSDIAAELTDSLSRSGKGAMSAPLELADGTVSLPALSFDNDTDCGLYRIGANNIGVTVNQVKTAGFTTTGIVAPLGITVTQSTADGTAITATGGASNGTAIVATGDGTGRGLTVTGGDTSGTAVFATGGAPNGTAVVATASGSGNGVTAAAAGAGHGLQGTGFDNASASGVYGIGIGASVGGRFVGDSSFAVTVGTGNMKMTGANPSSSVGFTNTLLPANIPKCFGAFSTNSGAPSISAGFNLNNVTCDTTDTTITIADDMASGSYIVMVTMEGTTASYIPVVHTKAAGSFKIRMLGYNTGGGTWDTINPSSGAYLMNFVVFGAQ